MPHGPNMLIDNLWILFSAILVIFMTIPGLSLFYAGMVRRKNVISILMKSLTICSLITILWFVIGYSLSFSPGNAFIGGFSKMFLHNVQLYNTPTTSISYNYNAPDIYEGVYILYSLSFAIIAPVLITGAFAERMKFSSSILFSLLWSILVYCPVAHMVWDHNGWLAQMGVLDYAGGTVVHITSGVAGLVAAIMLGKRDVIKQKESYVPYNLVFSFIGATILWIGWFGFNGGSTYAFNERSVLSIINTQVAAAAGAITWIVIEAFKEKPTYIGAAAGAISGLVAITPCAGFIEPSSAILLGTLSGIGCYLACVKVKAIFNYDDALDAFGIHGVGGIIGAIMTGVLANTVLTDGVTPNLYKQIFGVIIAIIYTAVMSALILYVLKKTIGIRVDAATEDLGLDQTTHGTKV